MLCRNINLPIHSFFKHGEKVQSKINIITLGVKENELCIRLQESYLGCRALPLAGCFYFLLLN
jgi:hypothetical protein